MNIKKLIFSCAVFLVVAGVFNMLCFWLVDEYTSSFYISIVFANSSIIVFALASLLMSFKGKYVYLSFYDAFIIGGYSLVSVLLNLLFALLDMNNVKVNIIVNVLILSIYLIVLFIFFANTAAITSQSEHDRCERNAYYSFKDMADSMLGKGSNPYVNRRLEFLCDRISSCQINRTTDVRDIDDRLMKALAQLQSKLEMCAPDSEVTGCINKVISAADERDKRITEALKR